MKSISLLLITLIFCNGVIAQNVGIGTTSPNSSAQLDVSSTTKGLLLPRMTTAQRGAIASPAQGLMVYDTDTKSNWYHNGTAWTNMAGGGGFSLPYLASVNLNTDVFRINNAGTGPSINGHSTNEFGIGVKGTASGAYGYGVYAYSDQANGVAVYGDAGSATGVKGYSVGGLGVDARSTNNTALKASIILGANANPTILATHAGAGNAIEATSQTGYGVRAITSTASSVGAAVYGANNGTQGNGVYGNANFASGVGVKGESNNGIGVSGYSGNNKGVSGATISGTALYGNGGSGYGLEVLGKVKISGGNTTPAVGAVLTSIDASGNAVWRQPVKVAFRATGVYTGLNVIPSFTTRKMHFPSEQYDYTNSFQPTTSASPTTDMSNFVAPVSGLYHFEFALSMQLADLSDDFESLTASIIIKRGANTIFAARSETPCCDAKGFAVNILVSSDFKLIIGDDVYVEIRQSNDGEAGATISNSSFDTYFCGRLIYAD